MTRHRKGYGHRDDEDECWHNPKAQLYCIYRDNFSNRAISEAKNLSNRSLQNDKTTGKDNADEMD